jgi:hypothetical protein
MTPGCQVLFAKNGKVFYQKSFGFYTYDSIQKVLPNDLYDIASITKIAATTISLMKLYDEKKFLLESTVSNYLKLPKKSSIADLKMKDILIHQAGFTGWIPFYLNYTSLAQQRKWFRMFPLKGFDVKVADSMYTKHLMIDSLYNTIYKTKIESKSSKLFLLALISISGAVFVFANSFTWMTTVKEQNFNIYNNTFTNVQESVIYPLKFRPARVSFLPMPLTAENYKNDQRYNRFWLTGGFGAFGYHNIKDIDAYSSLFPRLEKEQDPVIDFLMSKSKQLAVTKLNEIEIQLEKCTFSIGCPNSFGIKIRQLVFDKQSEKFEIDSDRNFVMVQNEIYSPVWKGKICTTSDCELIESSPALKSLRTWELPAGKYIFETYAETPFSKVRWIIFSLGAFLAIFATFYLDQRLKDDKQLYDNSN